MFAFIVRRIFYMIPTLFAVSIVSFVIIQLPPGDYLSTLQAQMLARGENLDMQTLEVYRERYALDQPIYVQYVKWISNIVLHGDFGDSFQWNRPVSELIWGRLGLTVLVSLVALLFSWAIAFPIGIYSAVRKYSLGDYLATIIGFFGLAVPDFLFALVVMYLSVSVLGQSVGGLFSPEFIDAPWSLARVVDLIAHLWIPILIIGTSSTAGLIRTMRANLLDELPKAYVITARAKGLPERRLLLKYPVRVALNPFVSTVGWVLPALVSGSAIVSIILNIPTSGPLLLNALMAQDMYLAGSFLLILSTLTIVGTLISDILLAWLDPRIRYQ